MLALVATLAFAGAADTVVVGPGTWRPTFPPSPEETAIAVPAFRLDTTQVTNSQFLAFVNSAPAWRRGTASALYVDQGYLGHWAGPLDLGGAGARQPVVSVSWFAAKAYCKAQGRRLPTVAEWELAAQASDRVADASDDPEHLRAILDWYASSTPKVLPDVGGDVPNVWGAHGLHGLVWEWTDDFNSELVSADGRDPDAAGLFCGAGSGAAADKGDYAAFMRIAFRSSLQASYTTRNLGFRCAEDL